MSKRRASFENSDVTTSTKRIKTSPEPLSTLNDELFLRIFSNLSIKDLNICQRVSHHFQKIATDSQLWKAAYYDRFVRPRLLRLPGRKQSAIDSSTLSHSSRLSNWLDEGHLVRRGRIVDWKKQFKIRHNWSRGTCDVTQIPVAARPPSPPLLAKLHNGIVYTVDGDRGLRAWSYKDTQRLLAQHTVEHMSVQQAPQGSCRVSRDPLPTSLAVDFHPEQSKEERLAIGFDDGSFRLYVYRTLEHEFQLLYAHPPSSNGTVTAIAAVDPYVMCMAESQILSLYKFNNSTINRATRSALDAPVLLLSLKSHTVWPPVSLSMRRSGSKIVASIAYSIPGFLYGWSVGIQELQLGVDGDIFNSRTASALAQGFSPLLFSSGASSAVAIPASSERQSQRYARPTSISYSHPYILVSHSDNTLTLYMATSTASDLVIGPGKRLFGHTSSVCSAHIEGRGKAVSVGVQENDIRVWELEGTTLASSSRSRLSSDDVSVQLSPEKRPATPDRLGILSDALAERGDGLGLATGRDANRSITRGWVGFDEENLVILREQSHGAQALTIYGFS